MPLIQDKGTGLLNIAHKGAYMIEVVKADWQLAHTDGETNEKLLSQSQRGA